MGVSVVLHGNRNSLKQSILGYCMEHFAEEELWLVDSLQIFDPYWLSRQDTSRARAVLRSIRVSRPFTIYQLRDKLFSLTKLHLNEKSTVVISAINCFNDEVHMPEQGAIIRAMEGVLGRLPCKLLIGKLEGVMQHGKDSHASTIRG